LILLGFRIDPQLRRDEPVDSGSVATIVSFALLAVTSLGQRPITWRAEQSEAPTNKIAVDHVFLMFFCYMNDYVPFKDFISFSGFRAEPTSNLI